MFIYNILKKLVQIRNSQKKARLVGTQRALDLALRLV